MASQGAWVGGAEARYQSIQLHTETNAFSTTSTATDAFPKQFHSGSIYLL